MEKDRKDLAWELIRTEPIFQNKWIDFRANMYRFPNGKIDEPFYCFSKRDYVAIVATDEEGKYICVRQFRPGIGRVTTEFPAGCLERPEDKAYSGVDGQSTKADALEAAKRELREETGYESDEWILLIRMPSNATMSDNYVFVYQARNCRKVSGQELDETEFLNVEKYTSEELDNLIHAGKFEQCDHIVGWYMARERDERHP